MLADNHNAGQSLLPDASLIAEMNEIDAVIDSFERAVDP